MAHVQDRGKDVDRRWQARYRGPDGRERTRTFTRKVDADAWLAGNTVALRRQEWVDPDAGRITFGAWWSRWLDTRHVRPSTAARDESYGRNHLVPHLGDVPLRAIRQDDVVAWVATVSGKGLAPATVRRAYQLLAKAMQAAVDADRIGRTPCVNIELPKVEQSGMRFLSPTELARLADAAGPRWRGLVLVLGWGGLRIGEAAALRPTDLMPATRQVEVAETAVWVKGHLHVGPPKTKAGRRRVVLPSSVWAELDRHAGEHAGDTTVFAAPEGGYLRASNFRRRAWASATETAGLDGLRIHDLRHTAVSLWIAAGADPKAVSVRAGHTSVAFTLDRYGHLYGDRDAELAGQLDSMIETSEQAGTGAGNVVELPVTRGSA